MHVTSTTNPSMVRDLRPNHLFELAFDSYKNSFRYHGSHLLNLRRPHRLGEFSRPYSKGDPPHLIDWKVYARSDTLLIREQRDEASASISIVVDCSPSMNWPDADLASTFPERVPTKIEIAMRLMLNLAYIHLRQGDIVRPIIEDGSGLVARWRLNLRGASDALRIFETIDGHGFARDSLLAECTERVGQIPTTDICYLLTDALGDDLISRSASTTKILNVVHVLTAAEADPSWVDDEISYFDNFQSEKEFLGSALRQRDEYKAQITAWQQRIREQLVRSGHRYQMVTDRTSIQVFHQELWES